MLKTLPSTWTLIVDSWASFTKNWNETFKISIWFLYFGLVTFIGAVLQKVSGSTIFTFVNNALSIVIGIGYLWAAIRLLQGALEIESGKKISLNSAMMQKAFNLILPVIGIALMQFIVIMGGLLLFILPGIYFIIALTFTQLIRVTGEAKGFDALAASRNLVKGRWWATCWRVLAGNIFFGIGVGCLMSLLISLLAVISGNIDPFILNGAHAFKRDPLVQGSYELLQSVFQSAVLPLFIIYQVKLFNALKATKAS